MDDKKEIEELQMRVIALETTVAYQDKTISDLDIVIQEQYALLEQLSKRIDVVGAKMEEQALLGDHTLEEERPPHY
jgi:SlyX protein